MAWYLSEIVTDLSPLREILALYDQTGSFPENVFHEEYKKLLVPLLRAFDFNSDHIDTDTIPAVYENDQYKWLASGYHDLILILGLVEQNCNEKELQYSFKLTETGTNVINQVVSMPQLMNSTLPFWKNDQGVQPFPVILKIIAEIKQRKLYPCDGLLLLEVLIILTWLNKPHGHINPYEQIYKSRKAYYAHMAGEPGIDLIQYSDFLWEQLSEDYSNYFAANYPARATLQLMMYADDLTYGPVPDEIFGLVQYITTAE